MKIILAVAAATLVSVPILALPMRNGPDGAPNVEQSRQGACSTDQRAHIGIGGLSAHVPLAISGGAARSKGCASD